jgi:hypothetical protein
MTGLDRAAVALGLASLASLAVAQLRERFAILPLDSWSVWIAVGLGLAAIVAGLTRRRTVATATGAAFLVAALVQVAFWAAGDNWLGGNGSTASVWLGLGTGLVLVGTADRIWPDGTTRKERK